MNEANDRTLFRSMVEALEEGIQWKRGEKELPVTVLETPKVTSTEQAQVREYAVLYAQGEDGWEATVPDLPGCEAIGDSLEEAQNLIRYFIKTHLQTLRMNRQPVPSPRTRVEHVRVAA